MLTQSPHTFIGGLPLACLDAQLIKGERKASHTRHIDTHPLRRIVPLTRRAAAAVELVPPFHPSQHHAPAK